MFFQFNADSRILRGGDSGGGGGYSPPPAPDPAATAAAQGGQDRATAKTNAVMLNPNVVSPYGSITYDTNSYNVDPNSNSVTRPTQTTTLSPAQQQQLDYRNNIMTTLGGIGQNWADTFQSRNPLTYNTGNIPSNVDLSGVSPAGNMSDYQGQADQASKAYYDKTYNLMNPAFQQQQRQLEDKLVNSGNPLNSEAYNTQMGNFQRGQNESLSNLADQSVTQGYNVQNQLFNNANTTRQNQIQMAMLPYQTQSQLSQDQFAREQAQQNQNINAMSALLTGSQAISTPQLPVGGQYNGTAQTSPNLMGMTQSNYQNQLGAYNNQYNANTSSNNAMTQGLFSLGGALGSMFF